MKVVTNCTIGNSFGYWGHHVPAGKFAVVEDCELSNGGVGPCTVDGILYASAERALAKHPDAKLPCIETRSAEELLKLQEEC